MDDKAKIRNPKLFFSSYIVSRLAVVVIEKGDLERTFSLYVENSLPNAVAGKALYKVGSIIRNKYFPKRSVFLILNNKKGVM